MENKTCNAIPEFYIQNIRGTLAGFNMRAHTTVHELFQEVRSITGVNFHFDMTIHYSKIKKGFCYKATPEDGPAKDLLLEMEIVNVNSDVTSYNLQVGHKMRLLHQFTRPPKRTKNLLKYRVRNGICERSCQAAELVIEFSAVIGVRFYPARKTLANSINENVIEEFFLNAEEDTLYKGMQLSILSIDDWVREWSLDFGGKNISYGTMITPSNLELQKGRDQ